MKVCKTCGAIKKKGAAMRVLGMRYPAHRCDLVAYKQRDDGAWLLRRREIVPKDG